MECILLIKDILNFLSYSTNLTHTYPTNYFLTMYFLLLKIMDKWLQSAHSRRLPNPTFGTSGRRCSRSQLGGRLATTLVDRYFHHSFLFSLVLFFLFPRIGPLSRPRRPFWGPLAAILDCDSMFLIEGVLGSKNLFSESGSKRSIT